MCTFEELKKEYLEQKEKLMEFYWKTLLSLGIGIAFFSDNLKDKYHILIYFSFPMMMFYYGIYKNYYGNYKEIKEKYLKILSQEEKKKIEKDDNLLEVGVYCLFVAILGIIIVSILYDYLKIFL